MSHSSYATGLTHRLTTFFGLSIHILSVVFMARLTIDVGTRMLYPFIPQFSAGLGLSIVGFSWLLFIRSLVGIAGPLFGYLADRHGRRKLMVTGLLTQAIGVIGLALSQQWWAVIAIVFYGVCLMAFIPAEQAYISDLAAYEKQGRALGAIEFSWAASGIFALPLVGWLIDAFGWRTPLILLGLLSIVQAAALWLLLPAVEERSTSTHLTGAEMWRVFLRPNVLASTSVAALLFVGIGCFSTIWSIWLSADFGLGATTLGLIATGIGLAELTGSVSASLFIDRVGLWRGSMLGLFLSTAAFMLLPYTQLSLPLAVLGLLLIGMFIEFTVVALIPLYAAQAPEAKATVFSLVGVGVAIGVSVASPLTAILWEKSGLWAVCLAALLSLCAAAVLSWRFLRG